MSSEHNGPKNPVFVHETGSIDIADGFVEVKTVLFGGGLRYIKITVSQNADPGESHKVVFNENDGNNQLVIVHGTPAQVTLSDKAPDQMSIRRIYLSAGKDGTTFSIIGNA